jgi:type IV pilus assembly protein PilE
MTASSGSLRFMRKRQRGVTLIELVTVMVIVAILAAMAIPGYRQYIIRANRTDAKTALLNTSAALERCYTRFSTYRSPPCTVANNVLTANSTYRIVVAPGADPNTQFNLSAVPQGAQAADTRCGTLTVDETGRRDRTGTQAVADCWGK